MTLRSSAADHVPAYDAPTLTNCDTEPIHIPGAIQPHGVCLSLDDDYAVVMCSANVATMLGVSAHQARGMLLVDLVGPDLTQRVRERAADGFPNEPLTVTLDEVGDGDLAGREVDVRVHRSGLRVVVELEEQLRSEGRRGVDHAARSAMARLAQATSFGDLADGLAREVRDLTAFDRVMVYRFDADWNGEVVAEARRDDLNPFLGLHYPATDIPAQARRLYTINPIRLIADIGYVPVPLLPMFDPDTERPLDLSHASLRSVSPIHVEYLSNMGVTASMSVSIVIDGVLWGLIACHHYSGPHRPSQEARNASEFVVQVASHLIAQRNQVDAKAAAVETRELLSKLVSVARASEHDPLSALGEEQALLYLMDANGVALGRNGTVLALGEVPPLETVRRIVRITGAGPDAVSSDELAVLDPELGSLAETASGVLRVGRSDGPWLVWFRPEQKQVVEWGGDPSNKRLYDNIDPAIRMSPRKSFDKWREVTSGKSLPWEAWHLEAADELYRQVESRLLQQSRESMALVESMQRAAVLDRAPEVPGVELVARYVPASTTRLGGDWWDAFELANGELALVVGDVAGHGVDAASAMTQLRSALRAFLFEGHDAAAALDRLDALVDGVLDTGVATAVVVTLDRDSGLASISGAGHLPPLVVADDGTVVNLGIEGRPLLGVGVGGAIITEVVVPPRHTLLLFTDGLVERRGYSLRDRSDDLVRRAADRRPDQPLEDWVDRLISGSGSTDDDTTVLAVRRP